MKKISELEKAEFCEQMAMVLDAVLPWKMELMRLFLR